MMKSMMKLLEVKLIFIWDELYIRAYKKQYKNSI